jgi:DHA2 family multidrug resistance protein
VSRPLEEVGRISIAVGFAFVAESNFRNLFMTSGYARGQLRWPNIVRAVGQALAFAPLTAVATARIERKMRDRPRRSSS